MPTGSEPRRRSGGTRGTRQPPNGAPANAQRADGASAPEGWTVEPTLPPMKRTRASDPTARAVVAACLADGQPRSTEVENARAGRNLVKRLAHAAGLAGAKVSARTVERDGKLFVVAQITRIEEGTK